MSVKARPDGYHSITPYLIVSNAADALAFYKKAFGAAEAVKLEHGGRVAHAEFRIGDSVVMLGEAMSDDYRDPLSYGGSPVGLMIYVDDADKAFEKAIAAGATVVRPVENQFYGDRSGNLKDPFGHSWTLGTHVEDVPEDEVNRRFQELYSTPAT